VSHRLTVTHTHEVPLKRLGGVAPPRRAIMSAGAGHEFVVISRLSSSTPNFLQTDIHQSMSQNKEASQFLSRVSACQRVLSLSTRFSSHRLKTKPSCASCLQLTRATPVSGTSTSASSMFCRAERYKDHEGTCHQGRCRPRCSTRHGVAKFFEARGRLPGYGRES
jgi:hypothetical protein